MKKRNKFVRFGLVFTVFMSMLLSSCSSDDTSRQTFPFAAEIFNSIDGRQVAFQGLTHSAISWSWDFGDGETSTEQNPVHVYKNGGYYVAVLTATDNIGATITKEVKLAIDLTPYILLTGGPTATNGKTWKLSASHSGNGDYFADANADLSPTAGVPAPLPDGTMDLILGMGEVYDDTFTFHFDGSYEHDVKADNASFGGIVYQFATTGGAGIVNPNGQEFGLCTGLYQPENDATFTYAENEDLTTLSVYGQGGVLTYESVSTLDFSGTEFVGFLDFQKKVIIQEVTDSSMTLVMFMAASPDFIGYNTHALVLSFEVVE